MKALDARLLRHARATRPFLLASVGLGVLSALLIVAQAWLLADVVSRAFRGGEGLTRLRAPLAALLLVVLARAARAWAAELLAARASAKAKSELRGELLQRTAELGLDSSREQRSGGLALLATRGIDALDGYFARYLPQLFLAVIVPIVVIAAVAWRDWISAGIIALTIPLIPLFMALVGANTRERMDPSSPDLRFDTLIHMQKPSYPDAVWELAVANGTYTVHLVAGDPQNIDSVFRINVEGVTAIDGTPSTQTHWLDGTVTVTVQDGRLTVSNAPGSSNDKLNFIEVAPVP